MISLKSLLTLDSTHPTTRAYTRSGLSGTGAASSMGLSEGMLESALEAVTSLLGAILAIAAGISAAIPSSNIPKEVKTVTDGRKHRVYSARNTGCGRTSAADRAKKL